MREAACETLRPPVERRSGLGGSHAAFFDSLLKHHLIFNTSWEDPALDRVALDLGPDDRMLVITGAGCNVLDYLLAGAGEIHAVDMNPCQNALLELKIAGVRALNHEEFFGLFGCGRSSGAREIYFDALRPELGPFARHYWDRHIGFFEGRGWRQSFYYRGTGGFAAWLVVALVHGLQRLRKPVEALLAARTIDEQRRVYESQLRRRLWTPWMKWFLSQPPTLSLIGIPRGQHREMLARYPGGAADYIRECFETVVTELPFQENYFWRVYCEGRYTPACCPEYLKRENFSRLRARLDRVHVVTSTLTDYLRRAGGRFTRYVLLDHMDWMKGRLRTALAEEWSVLLDKAAPGARAIYRSAGRTTPWLDNVEVRFRGQDLFLGELFKRQSALADDLHARDRVHTYGSFHILDLPS
jgi:S-adenosylmethionine-diacylglycerol 3-amino-3-carboxypropyl transferase